MKLLAAAGAGRLIEKPSHVRQLSLTTAADCARQWPPAVIAGSGIRRCEMLAS